MRHALRAATAATFLGAAVGLVPLSTSLTANAAGPAWTPPLTLQGGGAEPSIRNLPAGQKDQQSALVSAPTGLGSNFWYVDEKTLANGNHYFRGSPPQQPDLGTGGGDSEISVGQLDPTTRCSNIAYSGLHNIDLLDNFTTAKSTDCGESFSFPPNAYATQNTLTDRQWQTFDGVKTNHLIYHKVDSGQIVDALSSDGGLTYVSLSGPGGATGVIDPAHSYALPQNKIGNIVTDYSRPVGTTTYPVSGERIHTLYAIFGGPKDAADTLAAQTDSGFDHIDTIYVGKSTDGGLTWTDTKVFGVDPAKRKELDEVFPVIAVDATGNLYASWTDQYHIQFASSTDGGATWSKPFQVNHDNANGTVEAGHADIFPWMYGGGTGRVDVVWYQGVGGDTSQYRNPGSDATKWKVGFAQLTNATAKDSSGTSTPTTKMYDTDSVSPVIHTGSICNNGTTCGITGPGDRTLLDFFQVSVDAKGRANIAYATDIATPGSAVVAYVRQNSGFSALNGKAIASVPFVPLPAPKGTSCPGPQVKDFSGDAYGSAQEGGSARSIDALDILSIAYGAPSSTALKVTMTLKGYSTTPPVGTSATQYNAYWNYLGTDYYVSVSVEPQSNTYTIGTVGKDGKMHFKSATTGSYTQAQNGNGVITWDVLRNLVGNPRNGGVLSHTAGDDHGAFTFQGTGLHYTAPVDRAPDVGSGANYVVGKC